MLKIRGNTIQLAGNLESYFFCFDLDIQKMFYKVEAWDLKTL